MAGARGALIALEGVDRAGKSTQGRRLVEALRAGGHRADLLRFPERTTEIGRLLGAYLAGEKDVEDHAVHLLFSANRWEHVPSMKEKLRQGVTLVVDRYAFSGVAFTSAKELLEMLNRTRNRAICPRVLAPAATYQLDFVPLVTMLSPAASSFFFANLTVRLPVHISPAWWKGDHAHVKNFCVDWCKQPDIGLPKPDLILFLQLSPEEAAARGDFGSERYENSLFQEKVLKSFYHLMTDKTLNWKMIDASKSIEDLHREIKSIAEETMLEVQNKPLGELWK